METLKDFESIPQAKIDAIKIECQAKQIEVLQARIEERDGELECRDQQLLIATTALTKVNEAHTKLIEDHADALAKATEHTAQQVADKAAELLAESGTPPIQTEPEAHKGEEGSNGKMTEEQFWAEYRDFDKRGDYEGKNTFYEENKHVLGQ